RNTELPGETPVTYIEPLFPLLLIVVLIEMIRGIRRGRISWLLRLAVAALLLISWPPVARMGTHAFERAYPPMNTAAMADAQAIVVLPSAIYPPAVPIPAARVG